MIYHNNINALPFIIFPDNYSQCPRTWIIENKARIAEKMEQSPAILFRGFGIKNVHEFETFIEGINPNLYGLYGDLPHLQGTKKIYKSTPYPNNKPILFHNESSHLPTWPRKQWFYCEKPSPVGGCTPIVDCRRVYQTLAAEILAELEAKKLLYVRTFNEGLDVSWQDFFKTDDLEQVKQQCQAEETQLVVLPCGTIQTKTLAHAIVTPPGTGSKSFFNQIQLHHPYWLDSALVEALVDLYGIEKLPRNVFFGDGSPIPDDILASIDKAYQACAIRFPWEQGDILMLDNMLVAHGRDTFEGERKIAVAMADMVNRCDIT